MMGRFGQVVLGLDPPDPVLAVPAQPYKTLVQETRDYDLESPPQDLSVSSIRSYEVHDGN